MKNEDLLHVCINNSKYLCMTDSDTRRAVTCTQHSALDMDWPMFHATKISASLLGNHSKGRFWWGRIQPPQNSYGRFQDGAKMENFSFRLFEMATKKFSARGQKAPLRVGWFGACRVEIWWMKYARLFTRVFFLTRLLFAARGKCITVAENFCLGKKRELEQPKTEIFHFRSILKAPWMIDASKREQRSARTNNRSAEGRGRCQTRLDKGRFAK